MNRTTVILAIALLPVPLFTGAQQGTLLIKKGINKKHSYIPGDPIMLRLKDDTYQAGYITRLRYDSIFLNGIPIHKSAIREILLKRRPKAPFLPFETVAIIAAGSAMTSAGLAISDPKHKTEAIIAGPVIGFGPLLIKHFTGRLLRLIPRKKFRLKRKFYLQVSEVPLAR